MLRRNLSTLARRAAVVPVATIAVLVALQPSSAREPDRFTRWTATSRLPASAELRYAVAARVRPLLFWITFHDVGDGRIVRGQGPDGARSIELLIGSDPNRAPRHTNRWGYIVETNRGDNGDLIGVMTESDERTVEDAAKTANDRVSGQRFKAIRASVAKGEASAQVVRVAMADNATYRDLESVLRRLPEGGSATATLRVPAGTKPGFLGAVADVVHASVEQARGNRNPSAGGAVPGATRSFVYDRSLYDLKLVRSDPLPEVRIGSRTFTRCIESEFEIRNRSTGNTSSFRVAYGTDGAIAEVPVRIVYRPRWWFEVELTLGGPK